MVTNGRGRRGRQGRRIRWGRVLGNVRAATGTEGGRRRLARERRAPDCCPSQGRVVRLVSAPLGGRLEPGPP